MSEKMKKAAYEAFCAAENAKEHGHSQLNVYVCPQCKARMVTKDLNPGVTPAFMLCESGSKYHNMEGKSIKGPEGQPFMETRMYTDVTAADDQVIGEFYRPEWDEYSKIAKTYGERAADVFSHVNQGGLLFRQLAIPVERPYLIMQQPEPEKEPEPQTFREFHNELRQRNRMGRIRTDKGTYVRERAPGEIRGKSARRQAKREKVRALKAAQGKT